MLEHHVGLTQKKNRVFAHSVVRELMLSDGSLTGVTGDYQSPAATATHIHESAFGQFGPPRLAFPNPTGEGDRRTSVGCLKGPFRTGLNNTATGSTFPPSPALAEFH